MLKVRVEKLFYANSNQNRAVVPPILISDKTDFKYERLQMTRLLYTNKVFIGKRYNNTSDI